MLIFSPKNAALCVLTALCAACGAAPPDGDAAKRAEIERQYAEYRKEFPEVPEVEAKALIERGVLTELPLIVDVRTPEEQAVSMIHGAITKQQFESEKERHRDQEIVTYCTIGYRSGLYAQELKSEGFDVSNMKGSVLSWAHAGGEFRDPEGKPTTRVHVYGEQWNLLPENFEPVW